MIKRSETRSRILSSKDRIPPASDYVCRLIEVDFVTSKSSGNPMIKEEWEIVSPDTVNIGGDDITVAGVKGLMLYFPVLCKNDEGEVDTKRTQAACDRYMDHLQVCDGEEREGVEQDAPEKLPKGTQIYARLIADEFQARKDPTPEQRAKGLKEGDIMKNPVTGKPVISFRTKIVEVYGPAEGDFNKPY